MSVKDKLVKIVIVLVRDKLGELGFKIIIFYLFDK